MRSDMPKLLVERPRGGWRGGLARLNLRAVRDYDELPKRVSIGQDNPRTKWLSENLNPLARLLERRVGRPWDRVYSEIRAHLRCDDPVQLHVLVHLWQFVERHVVMIEGWPHRVCSGRPLTGYRWSFYVCPSTGLLRRAPWRPVERAPTKHKRTRRGSRR